MNETRHTETQEHCSALFTAGNDRQEKEKKDEDERRRIRRRRKRLRGRE